MNVYIYIRICPHFKYTHILCILYPLPINLDSTDMAWTPVTHTQCFFYGGTNGFARNLAIPRVCLFTLQPILQGALPGLQWVKGTSQLYSMTHMYIHRI